MSSHNYHLIITDEAEEDFKHILSFTERLWGERQADKYGNMLDKTLSVIELSPESGKGDLPPYRYVRAGQHYIFYRLDGDAIFVVRIVHNKMDFARHLGDLLH